MTDDLRLSLGGLMNRAPVPLGEHYFGHEAVTTRLGWRSGPNSIEACREALAARGDLILADTPGAHAALRDIVHPDLRDIVDELTPATSPPSWSLASDTFETGGMTASGWLTGIRVHDDAGRFAGTVLLLKPAVGMATIGAIAAGGDLRHFTRMQRVAKASRRPAAILFADLEASSPLARRLSTASYFTLSRRLARVADRCVIDEGGLVGRHVGDGVVAYFLAEIAGSESAAARACITATRALRGALADVAERSALAADEVMLRFGLHWGSTLYVGQMTTVGRSEVTALGDEVNEAARIEACAVGGRALASKALIERLEPSDATALGLDAESVAYTPLADLGTATEKARRDAPAIAVTEV
jgi:class 3 adenylate cyclase